MRDYAIVSPTFWTGRTGRAIKAKGPDAIIVAFYLMTCPSSTMTGLYYLPLPTLAHETGLPLEGASEALRSLSEAGFAAYDAVNEVVLVREMARYQIADSVEPKDNRHKGIVRDVRRYAHSPLFSEWFARYRTPFNLPESEAPKGAVASPSEAPSKPLRSQDQEQDHEQDQDQDQGQGDARGATPPEASPPVAPPSGVVAGDAPPAEAVPGKTRAKRAKPAPTPDTIPLPGTLARRLFDAIVGDRVLAPITVNPGDASQRWADPGTYPGVDVLAEVKRAGEYAATKPGRYTDGRAFLRGWLQRKADEVARAPKPASAAPDAPLTTTASGSQPHAPKKVYFHEYARAAQLQNAEREGR